ncbi:dynein regulatory complex protein 1 isoform X2 [Anarrhichthys ocellatus]|uniref:dynein regulatory complex protein 1 isoform X2 n=1 Tax=Anarrhichthys ocellatus TaxID=433405 RepID=UPI0012EDE68C|nr:dynein regulatory complex protein 1 isoform X2 [Anarrhichthys ocellatus]XP_031731309.1 dynein regulatory complex protein 1 isoform X2 [Anarrhichthys ocellatus]
MPITSIQQTLNIEEVDKDQEEESEPSVLSENQEAKNTVSTQDIEVNPTMEAREELDEELDEEPASESQPPEEEVEESEKLITPQRMINMQRDLMTLVTNIQVAADAKESMRRTELEEARRIRLERLENEVKSSQEIFQEITRGWSIAKQKVIPQDLQEALNNQQQLCAAIIEDNKKLIKDLQQEMKVGDDRFVKDLRKQEEELDLMIEMMKNQIKTLTKAYREELAQISRVYQLESEVLLTKDKTEWEQRIMELCEEELGRSMEWMKKVEEYDAKVQNHTLETIDNNGYFQQKWNMSCQVLERHHQHKKASQIITALKLMKPTVEVPVQRLNLNRMKKRAIRLDIEIRNLRTKSSSENKQFTKKSQHLPEEYKHKIQQYEHIQKNIKHFADADARQFEEMWLMIDAEVKQLVERVLVIDSLICKEHLGLAWERTPLEFMELSGPIQPQKQARMPARQTVSQLFHAGQNLQCSQRMMDLSVGPRPETDTESMDKEMHKEGKTVQSESGAEVEEGKQSLETLKKVMELLCDEAGFLMEDKLLNLLAPLEKEEQTVVKLGSLLCSFGMEEEDVPKLAEFLLKYKHQQREETEVRRGRDQDVCVESGESSNKEEDLETKAMTHLTSEFINPNHILPALKSFLEQHMRSRESSASQNHSFHVEAWNTSENEAYWENMGNIISEDKVKLWDATENTLQQYLAVLTEISELVPETQSLEQENTELRMLLQQSLN